MENRIQKIKGLYSGLSIDEKHQLIIDLMNEQILQPEEDSIETNRRHILNNKQGGCPYCESKHYYKFGFKSNSQRYRCNICKKTFTEYTGTWVSHIHKKDMLNSYFDEMKMETSLDSITENLGISKQTAFNWRHKILSGLQNNDKANFNGITESDETFFLQSEKGKKKEDAKPRKRGGKASKRGISNEQVAVIVTTDRKNELDMTVATMGRISKKDIQDTIGFRINNHSILCSDAHRSYSAFAKEKQIEHHKLNARKKQYVKQVIYHIQHVNSIDSRLKSWIHEKFIGVSSKYLQKYLNWYRFKETITDDANFMKEIINKSTTDIKARETYGNILKDYQKIQKLQH
jgi:transposase-like protein